MPIEVLPKFSRSQSAAEVREAIEALSKPEIASGTITARTGDINLSGGTDGDVLTVQADGSLAVETPAGGAESPLTLIASAATEVPLVVQGAASQTGSLTEWQNSAGIVVGFFDIIAGHSGRLFLRSNGASTMALSVFGADAYYDCATGRSIFRTNNSTRTTLDIHNAANRGMTIHQPVQLASSTDANAANSTLYFSTTQQKLVWKDASGVVNNLY